MTKPTRADSPTKICELSYCDRPLRARGLCSSHYNKYIVGEARRHPKHIVACVVCATAVTRSLHSGYQPTCSVGCRTIVQWGQAHAQPSHYTWRSDAEKRAREAGCTIVESFDRVEVFERDAWLCNGCGIKCAPPDPYDTRAATVDHIVPLALKGDHSRANTQTLCLSCNSAKKDLLAA